MNNQFKIEYLIYLLNLKKCSSNNLCTTDYQMLVGCDLLVSHLIRLKDSLISNKTGRNQLFNFLHWKNYQGKATLRLPFLVGCSQACLWTIQIPEFFDHQYVWKEIIATFVWPLSIFLIYLFRSLFMKYNRDPFSYDLPL